MSAPNKARGSAAIEIGGKRLPVSLSMGVLVALGHHLGVTTVQDALGRVQSGVISEMVLIARALLEGSGHEVSDKDLLAIDFLEFANVVLPAVFAARPAGDDASPRKPASK